jgi:hypothetical protein
MSDTLGKTEFLDMLSRLVRRSQEGYNMWRSIYGWLVGSIIVGGALGVLFMAEALQPLQPDPQALSMRSRVYVWPGHRGVYPPTVVYPYVYIYPDPYATNRPPPAQPYGYLRLEVRPSEAEIYVDGSFIGRGQEFRGPAVVSVLPGGHVVEFRRQESGSQIRLFVTAGQTIEITHDLGSGNPEASSPSYKRWSTPSRFGGY